jgi:hypothetical protein
LLKRMVLAIVLIIIGVVFLVDELWMFGLPIGHILPDLSEFHIVPLGFQYHHWMTGIILLILAMALLYSGAKKQ